jgi:phospholipid/cholesterol/gamma-HCH transport system substrate-binding protein
VMRRLALVVTVCVVATMLGACSRGEEPGYRLTAYFARGISLYAGSDVRVLGLPAGKIRSVSVDGTRVKVVMTVQADIPIPADVQATIVPLSLIGERYIQLFPAWTEGTPRAPRGAVIPLERTSIPVEPDEALAALKRFLDSLDPGATGRLVTNLADDLEGNGGKLNTALSGLADLTATLADKDDELVRIIDHFDDFTATLVTREQQLGKVLDSFATTARILAEERGQIERLVHALAQVSVDGLDLVSEHRASLQHDLDVLTRLLLSVQSNMDSVRQLLDAAPIMVAGQDLDGKNEGLNAAYDPEHHRIDLRNATSPVLSDLFRTIGFPSLAVCVPAGVACTPGSTPLPAIPGPGVPASTSAKAEAAPPGWLESVGRTIGGMLP